VRWDDVEPVFHKASWGLAHGFTQIGTDFFLLALSVCIRVNL
jgi:hypothetical protein